MREGREIINAGRGLQHLRKTIVKKYGYGLEHTFFKSLACVRMANFRKMNWATAEE